MECLQNVTNCAPIYSAPYPQRRSHHHRRHSPLPCSHGSWLISFCFISRGTKQVWPPPPPLAGKGMSATCRRHVPQTKISALLADISLSWRHKTDPDTVFPCRGLPTFTPFFLKHPRYICMIPPGYGLWYNFHPVSQSSTPIQQFLMFAIIYFVYRVNFFCGYHIIAAV